MSDSPLIDSLSAAVEARPDDLPLRLHLAELLVGAGRGPEAIGHATTSPNRPDAGADRSRDPCSMLARSTTILRVCAAVCAGVHGTPVSGRMERTPPKLIAGPSWHDLPLPPEFFDSIVAGVGYVDVSGTVSGDGSWTDKLTDSISMTAFKSCDG